MTTRINLGLQGGGAHGAFTWGALDRLLEDDSIEIAALSGTSAGALNGAALKAGWLNGRHEGARESLSWLWGQIGAITDEGLSEWINALSPSVPAVATALEYSPAYMAMDMMTRLSSPYLYGPMLQNPLERIVTQLDFGDVCADEGPELHICATNVRTGKVRLFQGEDIGPQAIMASACLPTLFQAVEIEGEAYWDGGYTGNPPLFPLFGAHLPDDILIININPLERDEVPRDSHAIQNRINEISFNSSLLRELRAIDFARRLLSEGKVPKGSMKNVLIHMVADDALMNDLNVATKTIPTPVVLARLKEAGRDAMARFLAEHRDDLGKRATVDLETMFA